jgi:SAM-dependent methyltransferase
VANEEAEVNSRRDAAERDRLFARYYDLEYRYFAEDIDFYVQYASAMDPDRALPLLELGCGTGRVALPLAEAGYQVVGIDRSQGMLDVAARHVASGRLGDKITLVHADMRRLAGVPPGPYGLAFCAINTFAYLTSTADQLAMLDAVWPLIVEHGILILDLTPPMPHLLPPSEGEVIHQGSYLDSESGETVHKFVSGIAAPATQTHRVAIFYDSEATDGTITRLTQALNFRWTARYEAELLLKQSGYRLERVYGGYELQEFADGSERMIFVART